MAETKSPDFAEVISALRNRHAESQLGIAPLQGQMDQMLSAPMPSAPAPDYGNPLAAFLSAFAGNLATGVSGNPGYASGASNLITSRRGEAQQTAREKLSQLMQHRSELLQEKLHELDAQRAEARESGDNLLRGELAELADKTSKEGLALQTKIAENEAKDRAAGRGQQQQSIELQKAQLDLSKTLQAIELATKGGRSLTDMKWNSVLDSYDKVTSIDDTVLSMIAKNPKKFPNVNAVFKADPKLKEQRARAYAGALVPLKDETPEEYIANRLKLNVFSASEIKAAAQKKWPEHKFEDENPATATASARQATRMTELIKLLSITPAGQILKGTGDVLQAPGAAINWLNAPLIPDTTKVR